MIHQKTDKELLDATALVFRLHRENSQFSDFVKQHSSERDAILKVLNNHEFIALGIRLGAFDEKIYKRMQCSNVLKVWNSARGFIHEVRRIEGKDTFFQELEQLAESWKKNPIKAVK
ncbi:hypothetical protein AQ910_10870 [Burkholderia pseudomallei]|nr:hypothetical protein AQ910_10870 [Burkholderia pseudomallei]